MSLVVDTSVLAAWIFKEERFDAKAIVELIANGTTFVPQLLPVELANVVLVAERKQRVSSNFAVEQLAMIGELPLIIDAETSGRVRTDTYQLAKAERLTVYDATYLELALRLGAKLATLDRDLAAAARRRGVNVVP